MLEPDKIYHVYNRGNNRENLFYKPENYGYFLKLFKKYMSDILDVYVYCLLPNHFHFLVKIKEIDLESLQDLPGLVSNRFRLFFMAYSKAINKQQNRRGSLFQKGFKSKEVNDDHYFSQLIFYIHANPQLHRLTDNFQNWPYSSYAAILKQSGSIVLEKEIIQWFGSPEEFEKFHVQGMDSEIILRLIELEQPYHCYFTSFFARRY